MGEGKKRLWLIVAAALAAASVLAACGRNACRANAGKIENYFLTGSPETRGNLQDLFSLLAQEDAPPLDQFAAVREIANTYARLKEYNLLVHFISARAINNPDDPYNSYYLLMAAYAYLQMDAAPVAAQYFDLIIKNYPDLSINGESIHLACLKQLIELAAKPEQQVFYYQELISRFPDKINLGAAYFQLAQAYERIGEWGSAIKSYAQYLPYTGTIISGFPNADNHAKQQVDFSKSSKDWTYESLAALLRAVRPALDDGSPYHLGRCQAKVNFFARSWEQEETDDSGVADFSLSDFMQGNRIRYADKLDEASNATEAYLRTWGWSDYIPIWYLYFRKIYFPSDPEIHGRWEWAGVYYGEKF
jgi:tetratricopeptide (TPR) repeat protein